MPDTVRHTDQRCDIAKYHGLEKYQYRLPNFNSILLWFVENNSIRGASLVILIFGGCPHSESTVHAHNTGNLLHFSVPQFLPKVVAYHYYISLNFMWLFIVKVYAFWRRQEGYKSHWALTGAI